MSYNNQYQSNPYQSAPAQEAGYGYGQQQQDSHELQQYGQQQYGQPYGQQPYGQQPQQPQQHANVLSQQDFLARVSNVRNEMRSLTADVQQIASLHQRALGSADSSAQHQLENIVAQTQLKNTSIRDQIRALKTDAERTHDNTQTLKARQFESLNKDFKNEIQNYLREEQQYKERYREQIARQFRIVNPDASDAEVQQAADADWGNEGIFQTALRTNRTGQASAVLGNVRARHNELQKIEQSIIELAGLFQDLDTLVIQQETVILQAEEATDKTNQNLSQGNVQVDKGIVSARRARKLKWWCLGITILILIIVAIVVAVVITGQQKK